jgi:hypothetical protein
MPAEIVMLIATLNSDFAEDKLIAKGPVERYVWIRHDND